MAGIGSKGQGKPTQGLTVPLPFVVRECRLEDRFLIYVVLSFGMQQQHRFKEYEIPRIVLRSAGYAALRRRHALTLTNTGPLPGALAFATGRIAWNTLPAIEGSRTLVATIHNLMTDGTAATCRWKAIARSSSQEAFPMSCLVGFELHQQYETAEKEKIASNGRRLPNTTGQSISEKEFLIAKQRYLETFANWLSHKAFCHDCKPKA